MRSPLSVSRHRPIRLMAGAGLGAALIGGCALVAPGEVRISAVPGDAQPVDAPIAFVDLRPRTGPLFNAQGGEVPRTAPLPQVERRELEEMPSSPQG